MSRGSKASGSDDEPLVPSDFDEDFYKALLQRVPEITKALRQKDTHENADNVQRLVICSNRYKFDLEQEQLLTQSLRDEIEMLKERLKKAAEASRLDQQTIAELRGVIEGAWKQKDAAQMREQIVQDELLKVQEKLAEKIEEIQNLNDKKSSMFSKRDDDKERDMLNKDIKELHKRLEIQRLYTKEVETKTETLEEKNKELLKLLNENSSEAYTNKRLMDTMQRDLDQLKSNEVKLNEQLTQFRVHNEQLTKNKVKQNLQILSLKTNMEHLNSQHNAACNKLAKISVELEYVTQERDKNKTDLVQKTNLLKVREDEIIKIKQENLALVKSQEIASRKCSAISEEKMAAEEETKRLKTQILTQDKELEGIRRVLRHFEKNNVHLVKERDGLRRDLLLEHKSVEETDGYFQESRHEIKSLKDTIHKMEIKHKKLKDDFNRLKKEKAKKMDEIQAWVDKMDGMQNEIHLKENCEIELKRTISDLESKCSKFQTQHDALFNEKNSLQRNVQSLEEEKGKMRHHLENLQQSIESLKTKVTYRDAEISRLQLQIDRMEKERRLLKGQMHKCQLSLQHTRNELTEKKKESNRCSKSLQEEELKLSRLRNEMDKLIDEKNNISAALTKRNDEYDKLKDDLGNLQSAYDQTEKQFSLCQEDMRIMRVEIKNLRTERNVLRKDRENAADLRQELLQTHRVLNQERIKARALQEEMLTPMNVHRWRNLRGIDPEKMDLIDKIQCLRKQILHYNVSALEQERALEESQRLFEAIKEFMLKLPSYKVKEQLNMAKATLSAKERKLKALKAELSSKEADEKANSMKLEEMRNHLATAKTQLSTEKKRKAKLLEERHILVQMQAQCFSAPPSIQRTLGAGFKIVGTF